MSKEKGRDALPAVPKDLAPLARSAVPAGLQYGEYRQYLRRDFYYSCAYCTMSEGEAHGIAFTIDHYEPRRAVPQLENEYGNLLYSCSGCNIFKGDRYPPKEARKKGHRFFRPDQDIYEEHFQQKGIRVASETNVGQFSIDFLELNRQSLRKIRELRDRLLNCAPLVSADILELRRFKIDQLPPHVKGLALVAIRRMEAAQKRIVEDIDSLLRDFARSTLLDPDPETEEQAKARAAKSKHLRGLFPGVWQARNK